MIRTLSLFVMLIGMVVQVSDAAQYKVLVVMSYSDTWEWVQEIEEGIESVFDSNYEVQYVYLDTRKDPDGGSSKAEEAYALYQEFQPDGVIAADDNAQSMFVVPYLQDQVETPVVFCGVNAEPEAYNYPASNVTGILERVHFVESIELARQLVPSLKRIGYIMKDSPTAQNYFQQFQRESETYPLESIAFELPNTLDEAVTMLKELTPRIDLLFIEGMEGMLDSNGESLSDQDVIPQLIELFGKPTVCANNYTVEFGVLAAVIKTGQEQGRTAAEMLLKIIQGTPVADIPITHNQFGLRLVNVDAMRALKIKPTAKLLRGVRLVHTKK